MSSKIIFVGDGRSYHVVDWYKAVKEITEKKGNICTELISDLYQSEGNKRLIDTPASPALVVIDKFLFKKQSFVGSIFRNLLKFFLAPIQAWKLRKFLSIKYSDYDKVILHAHSFYYILICALSGCEFIATPMGSDYLVRPDRNIIYSLLSNYAIRNAKYITVDSIELFEKFKRLGLDNVFIIQNGIDVDEILNFNSKKTGESYILSFRSVDPLYNTKELVESRNDSEIDYSIKFIYPMLEEHYFKSVLKLSKNTDQFIGRVGKDEMYSLFKNAYCAVSIPSSDASPRSVYEAIFCGTIVIVKRLDWTKVLSENMLKRIVFVEDFRKEWLKNAINEVVNKVNEKFEPTVEDIEMFDRLKQMNYLIRTVYKL